MTSPIKPYNVTVLLQGMFVFYVVLILCLWTNFLLCDHSNETSSAVLWHDAICLSIIYKREIKHFSWMFVKGLT